MDSSLRVHDKPAAPKGRMCLLIVGIPNQQQLLRMQHVDSLPSPLCCTTSGRHSAVCMLGQNTHGLKVLKGNVGIVGEQGLGNHA